MIELCSRASVTFAKSRLSSNLMKIDLIIIYGCNARSSENMVPILFKICEWTLENLEFSQVERSHDEIYQSIRNSVFALEIPSLKVSDNFSGRTIKYQTGTRSKIGVDAEFEEGIYRTVSFVAAQTHGDRNLFISAYVPSRLAPFHAQSTDTRSFYVTKGLKYPCEHSFYLRLKRDLRCSNRIRNPLWIYANVKVLELETPRDSNSRLGISEPANSELGIPRRLSTQQLGLFISENHRRVMESRITTRND